MLGNGVVPAGASVVANRGRSTRDVAAEFVSRKLWTFFAGTTPPADVIEAMRAAAVGNASRSSRGCARCSSTPSSTRRA